MNFIYKKYGRNTLGGILLSILLALIIIVVLIVIFFFSYLPRATNHGETITVPNIEGMQINQLESFLGSKDLRFEVNDSSYSSEHPPLAVLKQYPHAGAKVKEGRKIFISVNRINPPTVPVPNLVDGSIVNAEAVLQSNELKRGRIVQVPGPFNVVKEMKYKGAHIEPDVRVPKGSVIDLVVESGNNGRPFPIDDLVGQEFEDGKLYILGANLNLGDVELVGGDTVGYKPIVLKQKPEGGENVKVGDVVTLWIGKAGTEPPEDED
ncbi:PASTA domain-containing protein [Parachryseolinea silvisoli]|uniref:PASTA domain-containing protein n=1 Tax=Parachryseolinea silvisoli TaxID=2873601 RepID=UPI002265838A|nr:PASTA domain-containing protein [Parachryseolinea silvisoli]MCD9014382.1 PASTA domain-containing protein [Parachryseolinea silvisoli]